MTDRELLELAAKAAGYEDAEWQDMRGWGEVRYGLSAAIWSDKLYEENSHGYWNPLADDGDALRLAVKLRLEVNCTIPDKPTTSVYGNNRGRMVACHEQRVSDPYAATRRAIVRAAAEIGKSMSGQSNHPAKVA